MLAVSAALMAGLAAPASAAAPDANEQIKQEWVRHRQQQVRLRLAKMAERLEIKASQQAAWQAYASAYETTMPRPAAKPDANADAASITRMRADRAADHARKLAQIADATARLQQVLTPEQRKTLDQMAQHAGHRRHHWRRRRRQEGQAGPHPH